MAVSSIRRMLPGEKQIILDWGKTSKVVAEFCFIWERWKRWEEEPPLMAFDGKVPIGFHGIGYTKSGYINSVTQFVAEGHRGKGVAGKLIHYILSTNMAMKRIRFRTPKNSDGQRCWMGLNAQPFGETEGELWFDLDLAGIDSLSALMLAKTAHVSPTTDSRTLGHYRRSGVVPKGVEWAWALESPEAKAKIVAQKLGVPGWSGVKHSAHRVKVWADRLTLAQVNSLRASTSVLPSGVADTPYIEKLLSRLR